MAIEAARGCGFRKVGGLYFVCDGLAEPCERLPIPIVPCPTCDHKIQFSRSFQWIKVEHALIGARGCIDSKTHCPRCPVCYPDNFKTAEPTDRAGLLWIGEQFYSSPADWSREAAKMGVSRRIATIPKDLVVGKTWVFVAHLKTIQKSCPDCSGAVESNPGSNIPGSTMSSTLNCETCDKTGKIFDPAIFHAFRPTRLELLVTPSMKESEWVKYYEKRGVTLIEVPENDPDHLPVKKERKNRKDRAVEKIAKDWEPKVDPAQQRLPLEPPSMYPDEI